MGDALSGIYEGFTQRLGELRKHHDDLLVSLDYHEARALGVKAADAAVAPLVWSAAVGERWPTTLVTEFLHISRQALHKRVANGSALGLPGRGTTWFPVWQFDLERHEVRPVVVEVIRAFLEELGPVDPYLIAAWATTPQRELGASPEEWLASGKDPAELVRIARRAAREVGR